MCVLKEIRKIITFSLWCTRHGQKVTLIKNGSVIRPGKGDIKFPFSKFFLSVGIWGVLMGRGVVSWINRVSVIV